ncbi:cupin domain-containing protein [Actibacterium ureilyticum]|uniref:cupin domain-containing protein n=1 Tax=Actibacterium ureilyticum TaxID=1590614 RepID=UPI000BAABB31|nr:cupin domain-containing protein [Actibacterium ureilyticum]
MQQSSDLLYRFDPSRMPPGESHDGTGEILADRVRALPAGSHVNHVDLVVVRPGATIGHHRHGPDNEEFYVVIVGRAEMWIEDRKRPVHPGDVILNPPGGAHGLFNPTDTDVWLVVIEIRTPSPPPTA